MDFSEFSGFLASRSSVREFTGEQLTEDEIEYILRMASAAPSAGNLEAWDVVVVRNDEIRYALSEAAFGQAHVEQAAVVFAVCANYVRSMSRYGERGILYAVEDATIACTYMMLAAHARNIRTCWTGAFDEDEVREILDLPAHVRPIALLAAGKGELPQNRPARMPAGEHVHREEW